MESGDDGARGVPDGPAAHAEGAAIAAFREEVLAFYAAEGRSLPWRETSDPYAILVSEIMLQQTQVSRVLGPYRRFLDAFPDVRALADAPLEEVLRIWQGLGYNRRALALKRAAERIVSDHGGRVPRSIEDLRRLPGVGPATAAAVAAFAFGDAHPYIETNMRAAFIHAFFGAAENVPDSAIMPLADAALDRRDPRTWYYALMDYGAALKRGGSDASRRSAQYTRQSRFEGSRRQKRARLLRALLDSGPRTADEAARTAGVPEDEAMELLGELAAEGFLTETDGRYAVA